MDNVQIIFTRSSALCRGIKENSKSFPRWSSASCEYPVDSFRLTMRLEIADQSRSLRSLSYVRVRTFHTHVWPLEHRNRRYAEGHYRYRVYSKLMPYHGLDRRLRNALDDAEVRKGHVESSAATGRKEVSSSLPLQIYILHYSYDLRHRPGLEKSKKGTNDCDG